MAAVQEQDPPKEIPTEMLGIGVPPSNIGRRIDDTDCSILIRGFEQMQIRTSHYTPIPAGCAPERRDIKSYISNGVINIDKPANPSSHEVVSWAKRILRVEKTGHSGTLDPKVTGCLLICIDKATRLVKAQQSAGKEYVAVCNFHDPIQGGEVQIRRALELLTGTLFQRPPLISAVKRQLRVRNVSGINLIEFNERRNLAVFWMGCEAGTYVRTFCVHLGFMLGVGAHMEELRRVRSGVANEMEKCYTMHELMDAQWQLDHLRDEEDLRTVIQPLENLLIGFKRIIMKDTAVNAITYGAKIMIPGLLRFDTGIEIGEEVVIITTKGEAIALAIAMMSSFDLANCSHGVIAKIKRNIMDRDVYPRKWGIGPVASQKTTLKGQGKLNKYGLPNEGTPKWWNENYVDYGHAAQSMTSGTGLSPPGKRAKLEQTTREDVLSAPPTNPATGAVQINGKEIPPERLEGGEDTPTLDGEKSSKKSNETEQERAERRTKRKERRANETEEQRAERKRKKEEKKEKKEKKANKTEKKAKAAASAGKSESSSDE